MVAHSLLEDYLCKKLFDYHQFHQNSHKFLINSLKPVKCMITTKNKNIIHTLEFHLELFFLFCIIIQKQLITYLNRFFCFFFVFFLLKRKNKNLTNYGMEFFQNKSLKIFLHFTHKHLYENL